MTTEDTDDHASTLPLAPPLDLAPRPLPRAAFDLPGTGGRFKATPESFEVEELPAYLPSGVGEHLYLWIEKRGLETREAVRLLARAAGVSEREIGVAGQKDRQGVTRQWMSVATAREASQLELSAIDASRLRILEASRHGNKLRTGHLRGNRFTVRMEGCVPEAAARAQAILERLIATGLPNFFDAQRFGRGGDNAMLGAALLGLGGHPQLRRARQDRFLRRMALSALQSELFNRVLAQRMGDGSWHSVQPGDVLQKVPSGACFTCESPAEDQKRWEAGEVEITGPMPGHKERPRPTGTPAEREEAVLAAASIPRAALVKGGADMEGARRALRVRLDAPKLRMIDATTLELSFGLPSGSYATRVLTEVCGEPLIEAPAA